jgi:hypothetical protein
MFRRNFPGLIVHDTLYQRRGVEWPSQYQIDAHVHISWLGKWYRRTNAEFPRKAYLTADPAQVEKWTKRLEEYPKPWIGLAWRGGIHQTNERSRSIALADLAPVLKSGGTFVSLAYQEVGREIAAWNIDHNPQILCPDLNNDGDYENTLGLIAALDHVVTVTTTVAHVCGALGKRAYVLVPQLPAWRYVYPCGDGLIWYPENSLTLYRQKPGEVGWQHAIARLSRDFEAFVLPLAA